MKTGWDGIAFYGEFRIEELFNNYDKRYLNTFKLKIVNPQSKSTCVGP
jgi:hypothetical protein